MHLIEVNNIKLYAFHGCLDEEAKIGGDYRVDLVVETNFSDSTLSDELSDTVDYVWLNQIVREEMNQRSKLIEHVGQRIQNRLFDHPSVLRSRVRIEKICPPIGGDVESVAIIIDERREER